MVVIDNPDVPIGFLNGANAPRFINAKHAFDYNRVTVIVGRTVLTGSLEFTQTMGLNDAEAIEDFHSRHSFGAFGLHPKRGAARPVMQSSALPPGVSEFLP